MRYGGARVHETLNPRPAVGISCRWSILSPRPRARSRLHAALQLKGERREVLPRGEDRLTLNTVPFIVAAQLIMPVMRWSADQTHGRHGAYLSNVTLEAASTRRLLRSGHAGDYRTRSRCPVEVSELRATVRGTKARPTSVKRGYELVKLRMMLIRRGAVENPPQGLPQRGPACGGTWTWLDCRAYVLH